MNFKKGDKLICIKNFDDKFFKNHLIFISGEKYNILEIGVFAGTEESIIIESERFKSGYAISNSECIKHFKSLKSLRKDKIEKLEKKTYEKEKIRITDGFL